MKILVTGASGLLGRAVYAELVQHGHNVLGLCHSRQRPNLIAGDLTDASFVKGLLETHQPSFIIHCAAERRPDVIDNKPELADSINVGATKTVCELAAANNATVLFISSDYVFDGTKPPYSPSDTPNPLNLYGQSKLAGEEAVLKHPKNLVLRVPLLYGEVEFIEESAVTVLFKGVKLSDKVVMNHCEIRSPTHCADIGSIIRQMIEYGDNVGVPGGVYHWTSDLHLTKYDIACFMADAFNLPREHLVKDAAPSVGAKRPQDASLDRSKLVQLGISVTPVRDLQSSLHDVLKKFLS